MGFDADRFNSAPFAARSKRIPVPVLAEFFSDGQEPEWEVRGLTASELHRCLQASWRQDSIESIVKAIPLSADLTQAIQKALGLSKDVPGDIAKRLEMLVIGSVSPEIDLHTAVNLGNRFAYQFLELTNTINELTGKGADLVKPPAASQPTTA